MTIAEMIGKQFERYTVLKQVDDYVTPSGSKIKRLLCQCECGTIKEVNANDLRSGKTKSCGCYHKDMVHETMLIDLSGRRYGRLTVIKEDGRDDAGIVTWLCQCDCGNFLHVPGYRLSSGNTQSCGCLRYERMGINNRKDLIGQRFGHLTVIEKDTTMPRGKGVYWACICDCGCKKTILGKELLNGHNKTCGCGIGRDNHRLDLVGQQFGELTVIEFAGLKNNQTQWLCRCSCGKESVVTVGRLTSGNTKSCGCIVSRGEQSIARFFDARDIKYETQKKFINCKYNCSLRFDFWLPEYGICVEFDGIQHFEVSKNWRDTPDGLRERQERDAIKTKYCEENDIILLRIPYWEKDNIESILSDWLFLNTEVDNDEELSEAAG